MKIIKIRYYKQKEYKNSIPKEEKARVQFTKSSDRSCPNAIVLIVVVIVSMGFINLNKAANPADNQQNFIQISTKFHS